MKTPRPSSVERRAWSHDGDHSVTVVRFCANENGAEGIGRAPARLSDGRSRRPDGAKKLEAATNGRLTIQMFPSMQLGGEKEMIEQAQLGALQIARISVGAVGPVVDERQRLQHADSSSATPSTWKK